MPAPVPRPRRCTPRSGRSPTGLAHGGPWVTSPRVNRAPYAAHRWLSLRAFAQLAVWTVTGSFFAFVPRAWVHSEAVHGAGEVTLDDPAVLSLSTVYALTAAPLGGVTRIELRPSPAGLFFVVRGKKLGLRLDPRSGRSRPSPGPKPRRLPGATSQASLRCARRRS